MSTFDDNVAELRGINDDTPESTKSSQPARNDFVDTESQPLLSATQSDHQTYTHDSSRQHTSEHSNPESAARPTTMSPSLFFTLSTVYGATSVVLGAFGAHGLKRRISDPARIATWSTAAQYQLIHSVALLGVSLAIPQRAAKVPATLWLAGMTMFSGSIYLLVLDPQRFKALGPVTPLGGLCLIGGWVALGVVGRRFVPLR